MMLTAPTESSACGTGGGGLSVRASRVSGAAQGVGTRRRQVLVGNGRVAACGDFTTTEEYATVGDPNVGHAALLGKNLWVTDLPADCCEVGIDSMNW
mmetsp:Transcript_137278/g.382930  ORF Transcript_137278/g.382930 Transcript_137278/m.382930 type:complete len:97 (-) Transcript_137278:97-387(-)